MQFNVKILLASTLMSLSCFAMRPPVRASVHKIFNPKLPVKIQKTLLQEWWEQDQGKRDERDKSIGRLAQLSAKMPTIENAIITRKAEVIRGRGVQLLGTCVAGASLYAGQPYVLVFYFPFLYLTANSIYHGPKERLWQLQAEKYRMNKEMSELQKELNL